MTEFSHREVLFVDDDGLPMQFNIQNTTEKEYFKALIEHGGGMCTLSDEAIILVSPGTKVLSVLANKNLISSRFLLDCIKEDCLLDTDEYKIEINEMEASDFSDNSSSLQVNSFFDNNVKLPSDIADNSIDVIQSVQTLSPSNVICPSSNHDFDFLDSENRNTAVEISKDNEHQTSHLEFPLQSSENHIHFGVHMAEKDNFMSCGNGIPDSLETYKQSINVEPKKMTNFLPNVNESALVSADNEPAAVVSSSQENNPVLDQFDTMIFNKVQEKPIMDQDEDSLSQSYTVSSSADVQISPNHGPPHNTSAEIFSGSSAIPDSASQTTERQQYINSLEKEIEEILKKPSPKSIQDKIVLVKYICTVKKLPPATVLQTLQKLQM